MTRYVLKQFAFSVAIVLTMATFIFFITLVIFHDSINYHFDGIDSKYGHSKYFRRDAFNFSTFYTTVNVSEGESIEQYRTSEFNDGRLYRSYGQWFMDMARGKLDRSWNPSPNAGEQSTLVSAVAGIPGTLKLVIGGLFVSIVVTVLALAIASVRQGSQLRHMGRLLMKLGPAIPVSLIGAILFRMYQWGRIWPADPSPDSFLTFILASLALGVIMAYGITKILGPMVTNTMNLMAAGLTVAQSKSSAAKLWLKTGRIALLKLLALSPNWLLSLFAAIVVTEFIFEYNEGLGSMARYGGRTSPDIALNIGAVMLLTIGYASALFIANVVRVILDPGILRPAREPVPVDSGLRSEEEELPDPPGARSWPVFGRSPKIAVMILAVALFLAILGSFAEARDVEWRIFDNTGRPSNLPPVWAKGGDWDNVLGTDEVGRDLLSIALFGLRNSLATVALVLVTSAATAVLAIAAAMCLGEFCGRALTGFARFTLSFPIILAVLIWAFSMQYYVFNWGPPLLTPHWILSLTFVGLLMLLVWGEYVRRIRAEVLKTESDSLMIQLNAVGAGKWWLLSAQARLVASRLHWLVLTISVSNAGMLLIMVSVINFIAPSILGTSWYTGWGDLTRYSLNQPHIWWTVLFHGTIVVLTVLSFNFLGAWLRERNETPPWFGRPSEPASGIGTVAEAHRELST